MFENIEIVAVIILVRSISLLHIHTVYLVGHFYKMIVNILVDENICNLPQWEAHFYDYKFHHLPLRNGYEACSRSAIRLT